MNYTTDQKFVQVYEKSIRDRVNLRWVRPPGWSWGYLTHDLGQPHAGSSTTLKMTFQGRLVRAQVITTGRQQKDHNHKRSTITDFSRQSRNRLFDLFNTLKLNGRATFLTLTYPSTDIDADTAKGNLRAFFKRIQRKYKARVVTGVWRMEFQERGAIHFHIIFFGLPFIHKDIIAALWADCTMTIRPFTRIEGVSGHGKLINYVAKYVAKVNPPGTNGFNLVTYLSAYQELHGQRIGRVWGYFNRSSLPYDDEEILELAFDYGRFMDFKRAAAAMYPPMLQSLSFGFKIYVGSAKAWLDYFHEKYDVPMNAGNRYYVA